VVAHRGAMAYLNSDAARQRLAVSRQDLAPWVDEQTRLVQPDLWLDGPHELLLGGTRIQIKPLGPAHTPEDLAVYLPEDKVLYTGDLVFRGRLPLSGRPTATAGLGRWTNCGLGATMVPGHGAVHDARLGTCNLTRYLLYLRSVMAEQPRIWNDGSYDAADWSALASPCLALSTA
jgi:glyoxylase-like metal-dependent hydrolase (beta-lactamase superfamily II)